MRPWGTGQAVLAAEAEIDGPFAVVNADDFYGAESYVRLARFLTEARPETSLAAVGFRVAETLADAGPVSRALLDLDNEGRLHRIVEILEVWRQAGRILYHDDEGRQQLFAGDELVSMNMWGFTPRLLPELRRSFSDFLARYGHLQGAEFLLPEVIQSMVCAGSFGVEILKGSGVWCGLTFPEDQRRVQSIISTLVGQGRYAEALWT